MNFTYRRSVWLSLAAAWWLLPAAAQPIQIPEGGVEVSGVIMSAKGDFTFREVDPKAVEEARKKAMGPVVVNKDEKLIGVAISRITPIIKEAQLREMPVPEELQYMGGLTQIRFVFAFPEQHELVLVGPAEPWDTTNPVEPVGKITGRPIIQFDDVVAAMRTARNMRRGGENGGGFGCEMSPAKGVEDRIAKVEKDFKFKPRGEKMDALKKAIGPQKLKVFNTNDNTRLAFICAAADCKLKRIALGIEPSPIPGIGTIAESTPKTPLSHVWFALQYDPVIATEDGTMFQLSGPRLKVMVGEESFNERDPTRKAVAFAKQFNLAAPKIYQSITVFQDLQNMADLAMVGALIKTEKLDDKVKWDSLPVHEVIGWSVQTLPPPREVETQVSATTGTVVSGGVFLAAEEALDPDKRKLDKKNTLKGLYGQVQKMLEDTKGAILGG